MNNYVLREGNWIDECMDKLDVELGFRSWMESIYPDDPEWVEKCVERYRLNKAKNRLKKGEQDNET